MTHTCVSKLSIIGSDNGLSPGRRQAIIRTNDGMLLVGLLGTNFSEILSKIHIFSVKKMHLKTSSAKWGPFCHGLNVLMHSGWNKTAQPRSLNLDQWWPRLMTNICVTRPRCFNKELPLDHVGFTRSSFWKIQSHQGNQIQNCKDTFKKQETNFVVGPTSLGSKIFASSGMNNYVFQIYAKSVLEWLCLDFFVHFRISFWHHDCLHGIYLNKNKCDVFNIVVSPLFF